MEGQTDRQMDGDSEKIALCGIIGQRPQKRCPKAEKKGQVRQGGEEGVENCNEN